MPHWDLFRSQLMTKCQILLPPDAAYACVVELGDFGKVQFIDVSISHKLFFAYMNLMFRT